MAKSKKRESLSALLRDLIAQHGEPSAEDLEWVERALAGKLPMSDTPAMKQAITRDPEVMHGVPVFRGTRVPVQTMFDYIENGDSLDTFLEGFPTISRDLAIQVLEECKELRLAHV